jgi:hypothetical protein
MTHAQHDDSAVIDALGGTVATARLCEVTSQAVSQWRRHGIPQPRRMYLALVRPEAFGGRVPSGPAPARHPASAPAPAPLT